MLSLLPSSFISCTTPSLLPSILDDLCRFYPISTIAMLVQSLVQCTLISLATLSKVALAQGARTSILRLVETLNNQLLISPQQKKFLVKRHK
jgi:hypothetical protein